MKSTLTLPLSLVLTITANAQLAPQTNAPLYRHMLEVNAQWKNMDASLVSDERTVHFTGEADRIAQHLHLVAGYLRTHAAEGLSTEAATNRAALLNDLDSYAERGRFPQNHVLPFRNPVFIDPNGTACAVGQLMIESGHNELAESISKEMNLAYVHDMKRADVAHWATEEGFKEDELAWIQPGYPPSTQWDAPGGGTNGSVKVLLGLPDGTLLVAGAFTQAGGVAAHNVAVWNGSTYMALGSGVNGAITCGEVFNGNIYLGGSGFNANNDLATWNGTQWNYTAVFQGKYPYMAALHVKGDTLFAAGEVQGFAGPDDHVAYLNGTEWQFVFGTFTGPVLCLGTHNGKLVAGGEFTGIEIGDPVLGANHIAILNSNGWAQLGDGLDGAVHALVDVNDTLYAGGSMFANVVPLFGLARMAPGAGTWEPLMPNLTSYVIQQLGATQVNSLAWDGEHLFMGGAFELSGLNLIQGKHLARFAGAADQFEPLADFNAPVNAIAANPLIDVPGLFAGGEFTTNTGTDTVAYIAETQISTSIRTPAAVATFTLFPNPATDRLTLSLGDQVPLKGRLEVTDAQGRKVLSQALEQREMTLDVTALAPGAYTLRLIGTAGESAQPFIKR